MRNMYAATNWDLACDSCVLGANNNVRSEAKQTAYYVQDKGNYCECVALMEILAFAYDDYFDENSIISGDKLRKCMKMGGLMGNKPLSGS